MFSSRRLFLFLTNMATTNEEEANGCIQIQQKDPTETLMAPEPAATEEVVVMIPQQHQQVQHQSSDKSQEEDLLAEAASKTLIEIGANEACRSLLNAGDEFNDFGELSGAIAAVCKLTDAVFTIHDCQTITKANRSRCVKVEPLDEKFKYKYVKYVCKQFGCSRRRNVPGIRPNQKTYKIGCPALIAASVDQAYRLIDIGVKTKNVREYISSVTGKQLTTRDINNLKAKRKKELMTVHNCNNNNTESPPPNKKKKKISKEMEMSSPISSHVFDISKGLPATGLPVLLFLQVEKRAWKLLQKSASGIDGHVTFLSGQKIYKTNVYKLLFDTESYFKITDQTAFYPFIEIVFQVTDPNHNHHIPIQISPHSYSCHRELTQQESDLVLTPSPQTASPSRLS
ncbi:uraH [Acanthosepion pharaonis]|uniref:UraH n=1 Tax=Acanthosepion pharaonis TaxID=158019 RepID=A0A812BKI1_ACAPH|nr:uraH [Sepia pharaonis]